ncbi:hypothetical protein ECG_04176 [Echinococcus granulosus]|uniref:Expressed protein n=1 Tax=Echinococcus granulosus TaxID=6210 RepID=A0A068WBS5_ECHGR|nr:hypothetical protein ECG_04176 [Echinococcus granulosus]CDS17547.1 expressed protein [Echinococcus granulosus]
MTAFLSHQFILHTLSASPKRKKFCDASRSSDKRSSNRKYVQYNKMFGILANTRRLFTKVNKPDHSVARV